MSDPTVPLIVEPILDEPRIMKWRMSSTIGKLVEALAKAALKFDVVLKDSDNPAYRSKYADLPTVIDATREHLAAEGIVVIQMPHAEFGPDDAKMMTLTTMLAHSSGEWMASELTLPAMMRDRFDAQSVGSAITYARRYGLAAMTNVAQQDDDGNAAAGIGSAEAAKAVAKRKIKESTHADENEPITLVPYSNDTCVVTGNSLALLKADVSEDEKSKFDLRWSAVHKAWILKGADANMFASIAEKHKYTVIWAEK